MENIISVTTHSFEFNNGASNEFKEMFQIHIFSPVCIQSYYYNPQEVSENAVQKEALKWQKLIQQNSDSNLKISLYSQSGIFLITNGDQLIYDEEFYEFSPDNDSFEYVDEVVDIYEFIGQQPIDEFISNALESVGAGKIIPHIQSHLNKLSGKQQKIEITYEKQRVEDKESPKITVEVYSIEKNYKPVKISEFKISHMSSLFTLPEHREKTSGDRIAFKAIEIETGKVIENNVNEIIESVKYNKWQRKHPSVVNMDAMHRMELDSDDQDFLSYDDYVANDDEYEEGDDDYEPGF
ncbi:MAG: hypothetical protein JEZ14_17960 [Marinilabiliaceae bacterium]|nr:hypothetical protein [Marinilabiliaceae bacterium]